MIELKAGIPLTQEGKEFTPEIVDIFKEFVEEKGLNLLSTLQEVVSQIMGHNKHFLREFDLGKTSKEVAYVLTGDQDRMIVDLDTDGSIRVKKGYNAGSSYGEILV